MALPKRKLESIEQFLQKFPNVTQVMIDSTERPIARPQEAEQQSLNYSGKKKQHTRKHLAVVDLNKRLLVLTAAREGKVHDLSLLDEMNLVQAIPTAIPIAVDLGFLGLQNEDQNIAIPYAVIFGQSICPKKQHKKSKKQPLSDQHKQENHCLSRHRVKCEHAFSGIKRYNAISSIYRNRIEAFDDRLMVTAAGLWNFYLMAA